MATSAGTVERRSRARAALALLPIARAPQFLALVSAQIPAEVEHPVQDVVRLEVGLAAVEVHESSGSEAPFLIEHEPDAPAPARDGLAAAAALRLRARRALGAVDPREAPVREARSRAFPPGPEAAAPAACRPRTPDGTTASSRPPRRGWEGARRSAALPAGWPERSHGIWSDRSGRIRRGGTRRELTARKDAI